MYFAFIAFCLLILFTFFVIYIFRRRKTYTRERFAFVSFGLIFTFSTIVLSHIFTDNSLIIIAIKLFNLLPIEDMAVPTTDWTGKILSVIVLALLIATQYSIYKDWTGARSKIDQELLERHQEYNFLEATWKGCLPLKIEIADIKLLEKKEKLEDIHFLDENKDWHTEARELLRLISKQYSINIEDWHSLESIYISKYAELDIAIFCCNNYPNNEQLQKKINYLKTYCTNKDFIKLIVMVKNGTSIDKTETLDNFDIEYKSQDVILDSLVNFDEYFDYINSQYLKKEITIGDELRLQDVYVEPSGIIISNDEQIENLEQHLLEWVKDNQTSQHISLLGEYGQGKSVLSLKIAYEMINNQSIYRIPIIIELRGKSPKNEDMLSIIASWSSRFDISAKAIEKLFHAGKLLIILEGFDEMDLIGDSHTRHLHFKRLLEFMRFEKSKVIITGRPNLFLDTEEMKKFLQFDSNQSQIFYTTPIHLLPLDKERIKKVLRNVNKVIKNDIIQLIEKKENNSFLDLISRPSTLYQTSVIWNELDKSNISSASVIDGFIKHSYKRQELKLRSIGKTGVAPLLTINEREYFMIGIAVGMIERNQYSNYISKIDLETIIRNLYFDIPESVSMDETNNIPLKERLTDNAQVIDSVFNDVRTSGILVKDLSSNDSFKFAHKSFLEFLFSLFFVHNVLQKDKYYSTVANSISNSLLIRSLYDFNFSDEVISFISSYLIKELKIDKKDKSFCSNLLKIIFKKKLGRKLLHISNINIKKTIRYILAFFIFLSSFKFLIELDYFNIFKNISIFDTISYESIFLTLIVTILMIIYIYLFLSLLKIRLRKRILIWYKTCLINSNEEDIYKVINKKSLDDILYTRNNEVRLFIKKIASFF